MFGRISQNVKDFSVQVKANVTMDVVFKIRRSLCELVKEIKFSHDGFEADFEKKEKSNGLVDCEVVNNKGLPGDQELKCSMLEWGRNNLASVISLLIRHSTYIGKDLADSRVLRIENGHYSKYNKSGRFSLENGSNREFPVDCYDDQAQYIFFADDMMCEMPLPGDGVAIHMFSIRSEEDLGVGEFLEMKLLLD
ncbi:hypothetical protein ACFE04_018082 [Oxalis oulophora]